MSRPNRVGPPTSSASTSTSATGGGGTGIPVPVVQQAQQYLEENIKQWMEPTPAPQSREDFALFSEVMLFLSPVRCAVGSETKQLLRISDVSHGYEMTPSLPKRSMNT
ncbi:hypothetical protein AVEN_90550-1 [Araneus ventricosus]|uniref:Uncharacterized protein n=1 Tax=Araneus ventricosus TaxID=182803 RepID=A0A4Y2PCM0_ARAVE|nr:hypothetical protein AVEN_90550-1 [Araneus ventricosus]